MTALAKGLEGMEPDSDRAKPCIQHKHDGGTGQWYTGINTRGKTASIAACCQQSHNRDQQYYGMLSNLKQVYQRWLVPGILVGGLCNACAVSPLESLTLPMVYHWSATS